MKKIINFRSFNIFVLETECWKFGYHNHNFYELILVLEGSGNHIINHVSHTYQVGDVFLLTPTDAHRFEIVLKSKFIFIKYTEKYLSELLSVEKNTAWKSTIKLTLMENSYMCNKIIQSKKDKEAFFMMANILLKEFENLAKYSEEIISYLYLSLMTILARGLNDMYNEEKSIDKNEKLDEILAYISIHAFDADKVKISNLAKEFFMSEKYIGNYIKNKTGFSLNYFVTHYKLKTAEKLLIQGRLNINEIALKLGFHDTSHFSNFFKKHKNMSPSNFRDTNSKSTDL